VPGAAEKLERLLNLTAALLETARPLTADEIRRRVPGYPDGKEAFRRAFERDKDDLREMGVPLVMDEITHVDPPVNGYRIPKDRYYLRDPGLDPDELAALQLAASTVRLDGIEGGGAFWKLGGQPVSESADVGTTTEVAALPADRNLVILFGAVADRRTVEFTYRGESRRLDPYRLDFAKGRWYVGGHDHGRGEERNFRVARIEGTITAGEPKSFRPPSTTVPGLQLQPWQLGEGEGVTAEILVDAEQAAMAVAQAGPDTAVEWRDDGSVVLAMQVTNRSGLRSFVLGFLDHAEVLGPPDVRDDIVAWLEALAS
jgi:predicted DNA-binding transcriptional regulator YafY